VPEIAESRLPEDDERFTVESSTVTYSDGL
jgi:hypothetical protein